MTATLGDLLLVFLADRPGTAYDLQQRHTQTFGPDRVVDVTRVGATLNRLERLGYVRTAAVVRPGTRRVCTVSDAGRARQRAWLLDVPAGPAGTDVVDRVLLAMTAADRATFDAVVGACLTAMQAQRQRAAGHNTAVAVSAPAARAELDDIMADSVLTWLRRLAGRPRGRDVAA
ncbi:PadR family transcriptional regulator [Actinoplanes sp. NPDC023801]|uniref:PadR family transcriptional regulator n=1 Tax=Actinoplanes sp. NPDC023801 TaxID=3154595 RepID=UPI0033DAF6E7